jgi:hypothetical protein
MARLAVTDQPKSECAFRHANRVAQRRFKFQEEKGYLRLEIRKLGR